MKHTDSQGENHLLGIHRTSNGYVSDYHNLL